MPLHGGGRPARGAPHGIEEGRRAAARRGKIVGRHVVAVEEVGQEPLRIDGLQRDAPRRRTAVERKDERLQRRARPRQGRDVEDGLLPRPQTRHAPDHPPGAGDGVGVGGFEDNL